MKPTKPKAPKRKDSPPKAKGGRVREGKPWIDYSDCGLYPFFILDQYSCRHKWNKKKD